MPEKQKIIVVEDDAEMRQLIADYLSRSQFEVRSADSAQALFALLQTDPADLVVLDIMLPGSDGLDICKKLRANAQYAGMGIIMLTARDGMLDRVLGLELGADDYVSKPFEPLELMARIKAVLRRSQLAQQAQALHAGVPQPVGVPQENKHVVAFEGWVLDTRSRHLISPKEVVLSLPSSDYHILLLLLQKPDQPLSRDELMTAAFGRERTPADRSVDVCISRLRGYFEAEDPERHFIRTIRHEGYMYSSSRHKVRPSAVASEGSADH